MKVKIKTEETNYREAIRAALDWLAENGHIDRDKDKWLDRYYAFYSALSSWDEDKGTLDSGLNAAFGDIAPFERTMAESTFYEALKNPPGSKSNNPMHKQVLEALRPEKKPS